MKCKLIVIGMFICLFQINSNFAQTVDYQSVADKIVNQVLEVLPGEVVAINGTAADVEMLSEFLIAVSKAGGKPFVMLDIPEANKKILMETPIEYLKKPDLFSVAMARNVDCFINLSSIQNPELLSDVPEERLVASREADEPFRDAFQRTRSRSVTIGQSGGIPTKAYAKSVNADYKEMVDMFWKSVNADYKQMTVEGKAMATMLKAGSKVNLSSNYGTDIQFSIGKSSPRINSGLTSENINTTGTSDVWLPAGEAFVAVDPTSANGTIVVPSMNYRGTKIKNLKMKFKQGKMVDISADSNIDALKKAMEMSSPGFDLLSVLDIGLNPNSHQLKGSEYSSWEMVGMVTIGIGDNVWVGGTVDADNGYNFHLPKSTLTIDGNIIVKNGQLGKIHR